jgi:hypothetical protein
VLAAPTMGATLGAGAACHAFLDREPMNLHSICSITSSAPPPMLARQAASWPGTTALHILPPLKSLTSLSLHAGKIAACSHAPQRVDLVPDPAAYGVLQG